MNDEKASGASTEAIGVSQTAHPDRLDLAMPGFARFESFNPPSLGGKVAAVFIWTVSLIRSFEERFPAELSKSWIGAADVLKQTSLIGRMNCVKRLKPASPKDQGLIAHYVGVLTELDAIRCELHSIFPRSEVIEHAEGWFEIEYTDMEGKRQQKALWDKRLFENPKFLDQVVSRFLSLQARCYYLDEIVSSPKLSPVRRRNRILRASVAGQAANQGEELLHHQMLAYLRALPEGLSWKSRAAFFAEREKEIRVVLQNYQCCKLLASNGKRLSYGIDMGLDGLLKKFGEWQDEGGEFAELLTLRIDERSVKGACRQA